MLTKGDDGEEGIRRGEVSPAFMGSSEEEARHLALTASTIEPALVAGDEGGGGEEMGELEVGTDGGRTEATEEEPTKVGFGWVSVGASEGVESAEPLLELGHCGSLPNHKSNNAAEVVAITHEVPIL